MSNVFHEFPHEQDQWSSLRGDQPQSGQRMRGPEVSLLLSSAGSRSIVTVEVSSAILDIMKHMSVRIYFMTPADWPRSVLSKRKALPTGLGTFETKPPSWEEWNAALVLPVSIT